ncbi:MAG: tetratricopeptide repeat protein [Candidatus Acidiferrales bacterium]
MRRWNVFQNIVITVFAVAFAIAATSPHANAQAPATRHKSTVSLAKSDTVPVTTSSRLARQDYELGLSHREDLLFTEEGIEFFRKAVQADPHFALGHATLAFFTTDPSEEVRELGLVKASISHAAPDEKLLIQWMTGTKNGQLIPAIAAMNDLLAKYPNDKRLANMYGEWLLGAQQNYDQAAKVLEKILQKDPDYYPALNNLAYSYALGGRAELAPPLMDQYVAALPGQPNPQDSYAEILRMLGDFPDALDHYRTALRIAPTFFTSQVGIASTYALMGDEEHARLEYLKAIDMAKERTDRMDYRILWAMTYFRENRPGLARKAFGEVAAEAHKQNLPIEEAECHRDTALFDPDPDSAMNDLDAASAVLTDKRHILSGTRDTELAKILQTRSFIAARSGNVDAARKALEELNSMAQTNRDNVVQDAYHSANGAVMFLQGDYSGAISELEEDPRDPLSLQLLADAQSKSGQTADAQKTLATLAAINDETIEMAVVVPPVRAALKSNSSPSAQETSH